MSVANMQEGLYVVSIQKVRNATIKTFGLICIHKRQAIMANIKEAALANRLHKSENNIR